LLYLSIGYEIGKLEVLRRVPASLIDDPQRWMARAPVLPDFARLSGPIQPVLGRMQHQSGAIMGQSNEHCMGSRQLALPAAGKRRCMDLSSRFE
jgi:hypothetical protein